MAVLEHMKSLQSQGDHIIYYLNKKILKAKGRVFYKFSWDNIHKPRTFLAK